MLFASTQQLLIVFHLALIVRTQFISKFNDEDYNYEELDDVDYTHFVNGGKTKFVYLHEKINE